MLRRLVIGAALVCLMGASAYAQDEEQAAEEVDNECTEQLTRAEELVFDKIEANALSEAEAETVHQLLDEADAFCTEGNFPEASAKLAAVNKMVAKGN
ncbi:MAG: hypothetical protein ACOYB4_03165 [Methyloceanibacter sp.]